MKRNLKRIIICVFVLLMVKGNAQSTVANTVGWVRPVMSTDTNKYKQTLVKALQYYQMNAYIKFNPGLPNTKKVNIKIGNGMDSTNMVNIRLKIIDTEMPDLTIQRRLVTDDAAATDYGIVVNNEFYFKQNVSGSKDPAKAGWVTVFTSNASGTEDTKVYYQIIR